MLRCRTEREFSHAAIGSGEIGGPVQTTCLDVAFYGRMRGAFSWILASQGRSHGSDGQFGAPALNFRLWEVNISRRYGSGPCGRNDASREVGGTCGGFSLSFTIEFAVALISVSYI